MQSISSILIESWFTSEGTFGDDLVAGPFQRRATARQVARPCLNTSSNEDPPTPCLLSALSWQLQAAIQTPFTCLFLKMSKLSLLSIPLYIVCSTPVILVAFHWTHSRMPTPSLSHRAQS